MMKYQDGRKVRIGDKVNLGNNAKGVVIGLIGQHLYADGYNAEDWDYLKNGFLISTDFGLLRLEEPDEDMKLLRRMK
ncbi:hypothetical protein [Komagataeibacter xylinus]|uniref:hypothetical protein n=1 Tax=Komagataeibacter xylinus TaxID=28448 RepID=UPI000B02D329|nr:hypothetical protein [Komagataeibacter xylinus]GBQ70733.1 hypothetical protein AA15237_0924 [Komagataeibacter xylinus NBRC 15237]